MDNASEKTPLVGIIMGSKSDMPVMEGCTAELDALGVPYELVIASAHRNPAKVHEWAETAADRGIKGHRRRGWQGGPPGWCRGGIHPVAGDWRPREDKRPGRTRLPAFHGSDAFRRAGCLRGHQWRQERRNLRHADSRRHHAPSTRDAIAQLKRDMAEA